MTRTLLIAIALIAGAATGLTLALVERQRDARLDAATMFATPRTLPLPALVAHDGEPLTGATFAGRWDIAFFGFTNCPDICPTTLAQLGRVLERLDAEDDRGPRVWLVSVDPARDTPARLAAYVRHFDPGFAALSGAESALAEFAAALGVAYDKVFEGESYTIAHSGALFLIDPNGHYAGLFNTPHDWPRIEADLRKLTR